MVVAYANQYWWLKAACNDTTSGKSTGRLQSENNQPDPPTLLRFTSGYSRSFVLGTRSPEETEMLAYLHNEDTLTLAALVEHVVLQPKIVADA